MVNLGHLFPLEPTAKGQPRKAQVCKYAAALLLLYGPSAMMGIEYSKL
jgi:hypothetical protein